MSNVRFRFKLVLIGEGAVGKTSIRQKYMGKGFTGEYLKTIGADFASKVVEMTEEEGGEAIKSIFQIWDLAGQQEFKEVRASFYGGAQCVLLVFDLTRKDTMDKLKDWILEAAKNSGGTIKAFALIGNKCDLPEREISEDEGLEFAQYLSERLKFPMPYIETSAKTGKNIEYLFYILCRILLVKEGFQIPEIPQPGEATAEVSPLVAIEETQNEEIELPPPIAVSDIPELSEVPEISSEEEPSVIPEIPLPSSASDEIPLPAPFTEEIPMSGPATNIELAERVSKLEKRISELEDKFKKLAQIIKNLS